MRKTVKDVKKWITSLNDDFLISVDIYKNHKIKELIIATEYNDNLEINEREFIVAEIDDD